MMSLEHSLLVLENPSSFRPPIRAGRGLGRGGGRVFSNRSRKGSRGSSRSSGNVLLRGAGSGAGAAAASPSFPPTLPPSLGHGLAQALAARGPGGRRSGPGGLRSAAVGTRASSSSSSGKAGGSGGLPDPLLVRVARGEGGERVPVWLMRQAGRYMADFRKYSDHIPFRERSETPEIAIELSLQPWKAFGTDAVIMFSDILTPLPALGIEFDMVKGRGPVILNPVRSREDAFSLRTLDDPSSSLPFIQRILQTLRLEMDKDTALIGFVGSPWTLTAYAVEGEGNKHLVHTKRMMLHAPELLRSILESFEDALVTYMCYQIESGAQVLQIFDSWAHHLTPKQFQEFSMPYAERLIRRVRAVHPRVPLIFHANGGTGKLHVIQSGCSADVIGIDWGSDMAEARQVFGPDAVLQGNVDPLELMASEEGIRRSVLGCLEAARPASTSASAPGPRHILNVGHGVVQGTPEDAVRVFCQVVKDPALSHAHL